MVHLGRNILMVGARVVVTVVRRKNSCLTFIVGCVVHDVAVCGIHVTRLTSIFCNGLPQYCKRIPQIVGVVLWPRFRGQTVHGPVFRAMIRLACVWGPCSNPHSVNIAAARARAAPFLFEFLLVVTMSRPGRGHSNNKFSHRCCAHSYTALCQTSSS